MHCPLSLANTIGVFLHLTEVKCLRTVSFLLPELFKYFLALEL